jgi:hypothetical protein
MMILIYLSQAHDGLKKLAGEVEKHEPGVLAYNVFANKADGNIIVYEVSVINSFLNSPIC